MNKVIVENGFVTFVYEGEVPEMHPDVLVLDASPEVKDGWVYEDGKFSEPEIPVPSYTEMRELNYPSILEQLDMMYWDKVNGTNQWQQAITTVKATYPKDAEE